MSQQLTAEAAIEAIRGGKQVILVDDEDRENEGDLCMAAAKVSADDINFMARYGRGLICLTLTEDRIKQLGLKKMASRNESRFGTDFYVSIEARDGVTTGISAADRSQTIRTAVKPDADPTSIVSPGHVFPICARKGGVLVRSGQTEGSVDLARLAGLEPAGVICEIMKDDGTMARRPDLEQFAEQHGLGILSIAELIRYRLQHEPLITEVAQRDMKIGAGNLECTMRVFRAPVSDIQFLALTYGEIDPDQPTLVRVHQATIPTDVFGVTNPFDTNEPTKNEIALKKMAAEGRGIFVYLLPAKIDLAEQIVDMSDQSKAKVRLSRGRRGTHVSDEVREFGLGAQVLSALGAQKIRLMTDHPKRLVGLTGFGLEVVETVALTDGMATEGDGNNV